MGKTKGLRQRETAKKLSRIAVRKMGGMCTKVAVENWMDERMERGGVGVRGGGDRGKKEGSSNI